MSRIAPLSVESLPENIRQDLEYAQDLMGFTPNDVLIMARWPGLLAAVKQLVDVIYSPGELDSGLKRLMASIISSASGCRYCQAHTAHGANRFANVPEQKIAELWSFSSSDLFTDAERAALTFAMHAGSQPNAVNDDDFTALRQFFNEQQIIEMMGLVGLFGFLNQWNHTLDTELESTPGDFFQTVS